MARPGLILCGVLAHTLLQGACGFKLAMASSPANVCAATSSVVEVKPDGDVKKGLVTDPPKSGARVTFLETNAWFWQIEGVNVLVDPVMYTLTFNFPSIIQGKKTEVDGEAVMHQLSPGVDWILISQGFDDHCQPESIKQLSKLTDNATRVIAPPSAGKVLETFFAKDRIRYLKPGQSTKIGKKDKEEERIEVLATIGDTLGPPWQDPENGYILRWGDQMGRTRSASPQALTSLYYEPHCKYDAKEVTGKGLQADVVITPVVRQILAGLYPLVEGQKHAAELAKLLDAKLVLPMNNGDLDFTDSAWWFQRLLTKGGSIDSFRSVLSQTWPKARFSEAPPGITLSLTSNA